MQAIECDVLVVGGGVNGCGIARDAAGRGVRVLLTEQDDLGAFTSSASTKLIHGGLRYLEHYEFGLVRKALIEREVLLRAAPHIIRPLRFVMPHDPSMRPAWMIRAGLFLYDHLARRQLLPGSETVHLAKHPAGEPLKPGFDVGYLYSDAWVDDARLVVLNALDAKERGATILNRSRCVAVRVDGRTWRATLQAAGGAKQEVHARVLVNATGPWAASFLTNAAGRPQVKPLRLIKGSHIVVGKLFEHDHAYIFQNPDQRIIFAIPYEDRFTLIGTTDVEFHGDPGQVAVGDEETDYLCAMASRYFARGVGREDVAWSYAGVRPLVDDESAGATAVTRDYSLEFEAVPAPLLNVWGGKITTYRKLAEESVDKILPVLDARAPAWTAHAVLPGGECGDCDEFYRRELQARPWMPAPLVRRLARAYGARLAGVLNGARALDDLGSEIAPGQFEAELCHLIANEWAATGDDVLWRRSKLGLHFTEPQRRAVHDWMAARVAPPVAQRSPLQAA